MVWSSSTELCPSADQPMFPCPQCKTFSERIGLFGLLDKPSRSDRRHCGPLCQQSTTEGNFLYYDTWLLVSSATKYSSQQDDKELGTQSHNAVCNLSLNSSVAVSHVEYALLLCCNVAILANIANCFKQGIKWLHLFHAACFMMALIWQKQLVLELSLVACATSRGVQADATLQGWRSCFKTKLSKTGVIASI